MQQLIPHKQNTCVELVCPFGMRVRPNNEHVARKQIEIKARSTVQRNCSDLDRKQHNTMRWHFKHERAPTILTHIA
jgi:hypothetical protein